MADLFRRWKNELKSTYVDQNKTPEFTGRFEKIRDHWLAFVAYKTSEKSKKMSETNKINVQRCYITIARGQVVTSKPDLCGTRLRMT